LFCCDWPADTLSQTKQKYKMRTIENLLELEIGRHYKTEKGIPIVRVSLHDLEIAGINFLKDIQKY